MSALSRVERQLSLWKGIAATLVDELEKSDRGYMTEVIRTPNGASSMADWRRVRDAWEKENGR